MNMVSFMWLGIGPRLIYEDFNQLCLFLTASVFLAVMIYSFIRFKSKIVFVDSFNDCLRVCQLLAKEQILAFDIEGVNLSRVGEICLIQIACEDGRVYLFDICALKEKAFKSNTLRIIFENPSITKIIYDCRSDCDALYHQYGVTPVQVFDLQVLYVTEKCPRTPFLPGLSRCLSDVLPTIDYEKSVQVKNKGLQLFAPEKGGSFDQWKQRPLNKDLLIYAAEDVKLLFDIYQKYHVGNVSKYEKIIKISRRRMKKTINRKEEWPRGFKSPWAKKDF